MCKVSICVFESYFISDEFPQAQIHCGLCNGLSLNLQTAGFTYNLVLQNKTAPLSKSMSSCWARVREVP